MWQWAKAEELQSKVKEIRLRSLGIEHSDTLEAMSDLASTYRMQGKWKESKELNVKIIGIRSKYYW
jgi:hypothetical protein